MDTLDTSMLEPAAADQDEPSNNAQAELEMMRSLWTAKKLASAARKFLTPLKIPPLDCPQWREGMETADYIKAFDSRNSLIPTIYQ